VIRRNGASGTHLQADLGDDVHDAISCGDVHITAVIDWAGEVLDTLRLLAGTSRADWERHRGWLSGTGLWDPAHHSVGDRAVRRIGPEVRTIPAFP
jgi:hypothetical protein